MAVENNNSLSLPDDVAWSEITAHVRQAEEEAVVTDVTGHPNNSNGIVPPIHLTPEECVKQLKHTVTRNPLHREILYKTLCYCLERHLLVQVEEFISGCPEFPSAGQSPYHLLMFLVKGGGINQLELDSRGAVITPEQKYALSEDEIDDLIVDFAFETNEHGQELVKQMDPKKRLLELLEITPEYYDSFIDVLEFLAEKRSMAQIDTLLRGRDVLMVGRAKQDRPVQPSAFVDKLEKAGGIYWEKGWIATEEALELLATLKDRTKA